MKFIYNTASKKILGHINTTLSTDMKMSDE